MSSICLSMIVKNESHVIERALRSVKGLIDYWVICDTGSTDGTPGVVLETLCGVPGEIHKRPWVDFGHNRTEAIQLARDKADYSLVMDADMIANIKAPFKETLDADSYHIRYEGGLDYRQEMLVANRHDWRFIGATHEYIYSDTASTRENLEALTLTHFADGGMRDDKFERDAALLERELAQDPSDPRKVFYLAQTYRDLGRFAEALEYYGMRAEMTAGWDEERWYSLYQLGAVNAALGRPWQEVQSFLLAAYEFRPSRIEPIAELVRLHRHAGRYALGRLHGGLIGKGLPYPNGDRLFIEKPAYEYKLLLDYALCCVGVQDGAEAIRAFNRLLLTPSASWGAADAAIRGRAEMLEKQFPPLASPKTARNRLKVVIPFYNPGSAFDDCIDSLLAQDYGDFDMIFVDDASSDGSADSVPMDDPRVTLIRNPVRRGGAFNFHQVFLNHCQADDIVVHVDGDDRLSRPDALSKVNDFYNAHDCWVMYGQFRYSDGSYGISRPIADHGDFERLREEWMASHLRTFRAGLYHKLAQQDPDYACMKDSRGQWFTAAMDMAVMYPVMELAGFDRVRYNDEILYVYNAEHPGAIHHSRREEQLANNREIQRKPRFQQVESYH